MTCRSRWRYPLSDLANEDHFEQEEDVEGKFPFLRYAVTCWVLHAQKVERERLTQEDLLLYFHVKEFNATLD